MRILVVENDSAAADGLIGNLRRHGHQADGVETAVEALELYGESDLVLLDLELPDLDGLEVCRGIRADSEVPIIAVTNRGTELDRVLGLQAGADDYVVKPYGFRELLARIDAVTRRSRRQESARDEDVDAPVVSLGRITIGTAQREVWVEGELVDLTRKEFDLLCLLATKPGSVFSRERIMSEVWRTDFSISSRTIDTHVRCLRAKLGDPGLIATVRGIGFRLNA